MVRLPAPARVPRIPGHHGARGPVASPDPRSLDRSPGLTFPVLRSMIARVENWDSWERWKEQLERTGHCSHPVRVTGGASSVDTSTGEVLAQWSTDGEPDGSLLLACKDRRTAVCPSCAETYRRDTWHLIAAGLRGRAVSASRPGVRGAVARSVPETVASHPVVLATFTAPSFGAVHRVSEDRPCRERKGRPVCRHKIPEGCNARHGGDDPKVGQPLCFDCYRYVDHVLWHGAVPELWRRTTIYAYRALARLASERTGVAVSVRAVRGLLRISYVKVAEFQKRAAVHLHVVVRLDGVDADDPERVVAPPDWADVAVLEAALRDAARRVAVPLPEVGSRTRTARWGGQLDISPVHNPERTAAYLAKYATKTAGDVLTGLPPRRFGTESISRLRARGASGHVLCLVTTVFTLAANPDCAGLRLAEHVHTLGFKGHFATRSRRYSVTLGALRAARQAWRTAAGQSRDRDSDPWSATGGDPGGGCAEGAGGRVLVGAWRFVGSGFALLGDAVLAATLARDHALAREIEREQQAEQAQWAATAADVDQWR